MNLGEVFPVLSGLFLGLVFGAVRPCLRNHVGLAAALLLGYLIAAAAGELRISWSYMLFDTTLVVVSAAIGYIVCTYLCHCGPSGGGHQA